MTTESKEKRKSMFKILGGKFRRAFITGILVITPFALSIWILVNLFTRADSVLGVLISRVMGKHVPGLGVLLLGIFVIAAGVFARNYVGRKLLSWGNLVLFKIPLFNKIYLALKQILEVFLGERKTIFQRVVLFQYPRKGIFSLGFVTSESKGEVQIKTEQKLVNVFLPTTPNPTSGFLLFIPEEDLMPLEISVEEGIKLVISGGAVVPSYEASREQLKSGNGSIVAEGRSSAGGREGGEE